MESYKVYIGCDIIENKRIEEALTPKFKDRIYTKKEQEICKQNIQKYAARFAGKEAVIKALSQIISVNYIEIEILNKPDGKPYVNLLIEDKLKEKEDKENKEEIKKEMNDNDININNKILKNNTNNKNKLNLSSLDLDISLSHIKDYSIANVVVLKK